MTDLSYPLIRNEIRQHVNNNAYGYVRNGGTRPHQGWDLLAASGTPVFAIADGTIENVGNFGQLGITVILRFQTNGLTLYAAYAHLSLAYVRKRQDVAQGQMLGRTGTSGNARGMDELHQHLHFEIRTMSDVPSLGLGGRMDPAKLYVNTPLNGPIYDPAGKELSTPSTVTERDKTAGARRGAK
jgi:murein DD-endopeptidase MepM/ murein hydrolase activator NlpD